MRIRSLALAITTTVFLLVVGGNVEAGPAAPVVAGFLRAGADPGLQGRLLLGELSCTRCHRPSDKMASYLTSRVGPVLDQVGSRVQREYLRQFLLNPQAMKPGTTMPSLLAVIPDAERASSVDALVQFLASTGKGRLERLDRRLIAEGRVLYARVGCIACHGSRNAAGEPDKLLSTSVPLGDLKIKYTLAGLRGFLANPHQVRPSGRMPGLLDDQEAQRVAHYLLQGAAGQEPQANMTFAYYEGSWEQLPDFARLRPVATGQTSDFDLTVAHRVEEMALLFEGYLKIDRAGEYQFHLTSDDGSKLWIDGQLVVGNDGIHAPSTASGTAKLTQGMHKLAAGVFNAGSGVELAVDIEGPDLNRQPVSSLVYLSRAGAVKKLKTTPGGHEDVPLDGAQVARGRGLFRSLGCAGCHSLRISGEQLAPASSPPPLAQLNAARGCLAAEPVKGVPWYALSPTQHFALVAALGQPAPAQRPSRAQRIAFTLAAFNCYACHERDKVGGVEDALNTSFTTTQPEMGDEGRIPPTLTGVGAKLTLTYLQNILENGAKDRPYMLTRMPRFGTANVGPLAEAFVSADLADPAPKLSFTQSLARVKADARHLVGGEGLACIKCHTFAGHRAEGIQAMEMTLMPRRLQRSWFHRYLLNPQAIRPGTRMPAAWPNGQTFYPELLDGSTAKQMEAIWLYLADGSRAQLPTGLNKSAIPLVPAKEAIVYRGFITGAGPRGIAVGYPEKAHLAFDPNVLSITLLWQGAFFDAARHWSDRGDGFEGPLGDNILHLPERVSFARLAKPDQIWPAQNAHDLGYHFRGYQLSTDQRPTFRYDLGGVLVEDAPNPVPAQPNAGATMTRNLHLKAPQPSDDLFFRAAVANKIETLPDNWYRIDGEWKLRIEAASKPMIRESNGKKELLLAVQFDRGEARIAEIFDW